MNVRPLHDRIIVRRLEEGEQRIGGIGHLAPRASISQDDERIDSSCGLRRHRARD
jgi:co-chaperonin GroES (HSP10)